MRRFQILLLALLAAGCAAPQATPPGAAPASPAKATPTPTAEIALTGGGTFKEHAEADAAVVYDTKLVPSGARAQVRVESSEGETVSEVEVWGLAPDRTFGIHLHTNPCGPDPDDAGPHFRGTPATDDPTAPPDGTPTANPVDEVWLDIATDDSGHATATATQPWALQPDRLPKSLVIHEHSTESEGPHAGEAGGRAACITLTSTGTS